MILWYPRNATQWEKATAFCVGRDRDTKAFVCLCQHRLGSHVKPLGTGLVHHHRETATTTTPQGFTVYDPEARGLVLDIPPTVTVSHDYLLSCQCVREPGL